MPLDLPRSWGAMDARFSRKSATLSVTLRGGLGANADSDVGGEAAAAAPVPASEPTAEPEPEPAPAAGKLDNAPVPPASVDGAASCLSRKSTAEQPEAEPPIARATSEGAAEVPLVPAPPAEAGAEAGAGDEAAAKKKKKKSKKKKKAVGADVGEEVQAQAAERGAEASGEVEPETEPDAASSGASEPVPEPEPVAEPEPEPEQQEAPQRRQRAAGVTTIGREVPHLQLSGPLLKVRPPPPPSPCMQAACAERWPRPRTPPISSGQLRRVATHQRHTHARAHPVFSTRRRR